jgi:hypothetical protein
VLTDNAVGMGNPTTVPFGANDPLLSGGNLPVSGYFLADTVDENFKVTLADGRYTVIAARLEFGSPLVATDQIECRFHRQDGTAPTSYGTCPRSACSTRVLTLNPPPSAMVIQGGAWSGGRRGQ